jgi:hypothetical protein
MSTRNRPRPSLRLLFLSPYFAFSIAVLVSLCIAVLSSSLRVGIEVDDNTKTNKNSEIQAFGQKRAETLIFCILFTFK